MQKHLSVRPGIIEEFIKHLREKLFGAYNFICKFNIPFSVTLPLLLHFLFQLKRDSVKFA